MKSAVRSLCSKSRMALDAAVKVEVKQGVVVGQQGRLPNGNSYNYFQGIPYAVPPVGSLRFKSPIPLERFPQPEIDCTKEGDVSHQRDPFTQEVVGSENCLFLNVYAPQKANHKLPVMVWIHGGGFWFGSGNSDYFFPKHLMEEDVVVVTINYRLGALGFLCLPEEDIYGNAGLKDQRLALQWIRENIASFNGDPDNVTLFGESAGAASVHLHAYAKHAKTLFHKAIVQSGTANMEWVFQSDPDYKVRKLAELLGCTAKGTKEILNFLQSDQVTPLMLLAKTLPVLTPDERRRCLPLPFKPVIEESTSPDSFIDEPILQSMQKPDAIDFPLIMGYNSAEGLTMLVNAARKLEAYDKDLARCIPRNLDQGLKHYDIQMLADQMRKFYFGGQTLSPKLFNEMADLLTDYHFSIDMQLAAEYHSRHQTKSDLYFYTFNYVGGLNLYKKILQMEKLRGACHGDELFYLFQMADNEMQPSEDDLRMTKRMCRMWTNFAKHGNPTPGGISNEVVDCLWKPVAKLSQELQSFDLDYLAIDKNCEMLRNPHKDRIDFWRSVYRTYNSIDYSRLSSKL